MQDYWSEHTRRLPTLAVGDYVWIQNQTGQHPNKWDRTGTVVEVKQHDQYQVKVDGSGRVTLRNRRILLKFTPITSPEPPRSIDIDFGTSFASIPPPPRTIPPPPTYDPIDVAIAARLGPHHTCWPNSDPRRDSQLTVSRLIVSRDPYGCHYAVIPSYTGHCYPETPDNAELETTSLTHHTADVTVATQGTSITCCETLQP